MADVVIAQKDFFTQAPVESPAVFDKLARFEHIVFYSGAAITAVEISDDGSAWFDITTGGLVDVSVSGLAVVTNVCAKFYRVSADAAVAVMAH